MLAKFRMLSLVEGASLLILLFIAMPMKYYFNLPEAVKIVGPIHGVLFLVYMFASLVVSHKLKWTTVKWLMIFLAGVLPFGFLLIDKQLKTTD